MTEQDMSKEALNRVFANFHTLSEEELAAIAENEKKRQQVEGNKWVAESNSIANVPKRFWNVRFSDYPSEQTDKAKKLCLEEDSDHIFILFGSTGLGKTTTLCSAIHERAYEGLGDSYYFSMRYLEVELRVCRTYGAEKNEKDFLTELSETPFLCIDEVGTCPNRREESNFLNQIIELRYNNKLPTWLATNLSPINFKALLCDEDISGISPEERAKWSERKDKEVPILNRIKSVARISTLKGESFREVYNGDNNNKQ